jgi:hypothetical protein
VVLVASTIIYALPWRGLHAYRRPVAFLMLVIVTLAVGVSAVFLLVSPSVADLSALELLRGALLLWASNMLTFALWSGRLMVVGRCVACTTTSRTEWSEGSGLVAAVDRVPVPRFHK